MKGMPKKGDYVLATKWDDGDPHDQWCIGFYDEFLPYKGSSDRYLVIDENGNQFRCNGFRRITTISKERGEFILNHKKDIELCGRSLWWWAGCDMGRFNVGLYEDE